MAGLARSAGMAGIVHRAFARRCAQSMRTLPPVRYATTTKAGARFSDTTPKKPRRKIAAAESSTSRESNDTRASMSTGSKITTQAAKAKTPPATKGPIPKPVDIKSPEYKSASRKWTSLMVGLPFLIVSSYFLYDRLVLGNEPKVLGAAEKSEA